MIKRITFYIPDIENTFQLVNIDLEKDWKLLKKGQRWTVQTYLHLKNKNLPVYLSKSLPKEGVVVYLNRHKRYLLKDVVRIKSKGLIFVGIRGDRSQSNLADFELVQNNFWEDKKRLFFIPYWPQPGLIPRNKKRGTLVKSIAFKGFNANLHQYFFSQNWKDWIDKYDLSWNQDSMDHKESENTGVTVDWHNYENIDILIAFRPNPKRKDEKEGHRTKPATKLYNAWIAGVPAVLANEYAYQQIRKTDLDYIVIKEPHEVKDAILKLKNNTELYNNMVTNGKERAEEFTVNKISDQWEYFFFNILPQRINTRQFKISRYFPATVRSAFRFCKRIVLLKPKR